MSDSAAPQTHTIPAHYLIAGDVLVEFEDRGPLLETEHSTVDNEIYMVRWADGMEAFYVENEVEVVARYLADGRPVRTAGDPNPLREAATQVNEGVLSAEPNASECPEHGDSSMKHVYTATPETDTLTCCADVPCGWSVPVNRSDA